MIIRHNITSLHALNKLKVNNDSAGKIIKKLSSGLRVNSASDDAASLAISEKMRAQIRGLNQAVRNAQDGISLLQTAEDGMSSINAALQRMRELCVLGSNETLNNNDRDSIQKELNELKELINNVSSNTKFNDISLLDGSISKDYGDHLTVSIAPNINLTKENGEITTNLVIDGHTLEFGFTKSEETINITVSHNDKIIGQKEINTIPSVEWQVKIDSEKSDFCNEIIKTNDGGYVAIGNRDTDVDTKDNEILLIKIDKDGNKQWEKEIGYIDNDYGTSIIQTSDGGFALTGFSKDPSSDNAGTGLFVRLNSDGEVEGSGTMFTRIGGKGRGQAHGECIRQTKDGGFIITGTYNPGHDGDLNSYGDDFWIAKLNSSGDIQWEKTYGGTNEDHAYDILETTDGGYIIAGHTKSHDGDIENPNSGTDALIVKINSDGEKIWEKALGTSGSDYCKALIQTDNGDYIAVGYSNFSDQRQYDGWILKIKDTGELIGEQQFIGGSSDDKILDIKKANDGGYILTGTTRFSDMDVNHNGSDDGWIIKLNSEAEIQWQRTLGGSNSDSFESILQTGDGGYIAAGYTTSSSYNRDSWIAKFSSVLTNVSLNVSDITDGNNILKFKDVTMRFDSQLFDILSGISVAAIKITEKSGLTLQVGANENQEIDIYISDLSAEGIGLIDGYPKLIPPSEAKKSIILIDGAISTVNSERANAGAYQNLLKHIIINLENSSENLTSSESRIRDLDMAKGIMDMVKNNILTQSTKAILLQSNTLPQGVLQLLK